MHREKRKSPRFPFENNIVIILDGYCSKIDGKAKDISPGGMFIESSTFPSIGSEIDVIFDICEESFKIKSVVCWRSTKGFGIYFIETSAKLVHAINEIRP